MRPRRGYIRRLRRGRGGAIMLRPLFRLFILCLAVAVFLGIGSAVGRGCAVSVEDTPAQEPVVQDSVTDRWRSRMDSTGQKLREELLRKAAQLAWDFWYPSYVPVTDGERYAGDVDPSYRRYAEQREKQEDYERLLSALEKHSRLFAGTENGGGGSTFGSGGSASGGTAGNGTAGEGGSSGSLLRFGTVAGELLLGDQLSAGQYESGVRYMAEQLADYDFLMKHFYTVHPTASADRELMRAADFLEQDLSLDESGDMEGPQILIYHTHSQEEYADYHQGNREATIVNVGAHLARLLEAKGYRVLHDTSVYDLKDGKLDRSQAYTYALEGVSSILQRYPSIQVVLDLHRDGVAETTRLVTEIDGKQTASIMFFNGTSETPDGLIEYLPNPYRTENLAFSFQMKLCAEALYPGFTRNIYLKGLRYNLHLRPRSALIEVGAQTNTYAEAVNAMEPLAELLYLVLKKK